MPAGALDQRVTFQRYAVTRSEIGEEIRSWSDLATVPASVNPDGSPLEAAGSTPEELAATERLRIVVRWQPKLADLSAKDRVSLDGRVLNIQGVLLRGRRDHLVILAYARAE